MAELRCHIEPDTVEGVGEAIALWYAASFSYSAGLCGRGGTGLGQGWNALVLLMAEAARASRPGKSFFIDMKVLMDARLSAREGARPCEFAAGTWAFGGAVKFEI